MDEFDDEEKCSVNIHVKQNGRIAPMVAHCVEAAAV